MSYKNTKYLANGPDTSQNRTSPDGPHVLQSYLKTPQKLASSHTRAPQLNCGKESRHSSQRPSSWTPEENAAITKCRKEACFPEMIKSKLE